jgi:hypothetical protein
MKTKLLFITLTIISYITTQSFAQSPNYLWAKSAAGTSFDEGNSVTTDSNGNVIITGFFHSTAITFGTTTL